MASRPKATIADVARAAGVSTATAGRVLGGYGYSSGAKKEQVLEAARELGYRPNALARSLITGQTRTIGVVAGDIQIPFYATILRGIANVVEAQGFGLLITNSNEDLADEMRSVELLMEKQVDGLIVSPCDTRRADHLRALSASGVPLVLIDRTVQGLEVDRVASENVAAAREAVTSLIEAGHRRIGVVGELVQQQRGGIAGFISRAVDRTAGDVESVYPSWQRVLGYIQALQAAGLPVEPELIRPAGHYSVEAGEAATRVLLERADPPTALFTTDGTMSAGAMTALNGLKLRVPQDISFICFDDLDWMAFVSPGITAVAQPRRAMGEAAAQLLLDRIQGADAPARRQLLSPRLVRRGSVAPPR